VGCDFPKADGLKYTGFIDCVSADRVKPIFVCKIERTQHFMQYNLLGYVEDLFFLVLIEIDSVPY
jgi:hypothetical protein